jgi:alpha-L-fucosidase
LGTCRQVTAPPEPTDQRDWKPIRRHRPPEWYQDAKFGIFVPWGLYAAPAWAPPGELGRIERQVWFRHNPDREWYLNSRRMEASPTRKHHHETAKCRKMGAITDFKRDTCRGLGYSLGYNRLEGPEHGIGEDAPVRLLVDLVSKNGSLLLNVGLAADGSIPEIHMLLGPAEQQEVTIQPFTAPSTHEVWLLSMADKLNYGVKAGDLSVSLPVRLRKAHLPKIAPPA